MEPMLLHLHLVRHGQTFFNRYNRLQGWSNSPLTESGIADADKAATKLKDFDFAAAYCSDTTRAQMTAQRILDANEASGHVRPQLMSDMHFREQFYGYFEGQDMGVAWTAAGGPHGAKNYNDIVEKYGLMHRFAPEGYDLSERPANGSVTVLDFDTTKPIEEAVSVISYNQ